MAEVVEFRFKDDDEEIVVYCPNKSCKDNQGYKISIFDMDLGFVKCCCCGTIYHQTSNTELTPEFIRYALNTCKGES